MKNRIHNEADAILDSQTFYTIGSKKEGACLKQGVLQQGLFCRTKRSPGASDDDCLWSHILDPKQVRLFRKGLFMSQREAGELFGGGPNAFSRYERARVKPPKSLGVIIYQYLTSSSVYEAVSHIRSLNKRQ